MRRDKVISRHSTSSLLMAGMLLVGVSGVAQTKAPTVPDAQIEANVLKALAGQSQLADQAISTTTVYGTVTISGSVRDEASRNTAEDVVSKTVGVQKVVDELTIGGDTSAASVNAAPQGQGQDSAEVGTNPNLQSDGTVAPPTATQPMQGQDSGAPPQEAGNQPSAQPSQQAPYPAPGYPQQQTPYPQQQAPYPQQQAPYPQQQSPYPSQPGPYSTQQQAPYPAQQAPYGAYGPYRQPYGPGPYGPQPVPAQPLMVQRGGDAVIVPAGSVIRVRINQGMDSRKTAPGTGFDGVVLSDVVAGGAIAIPRGAAVQGVVADVHNAGQLRGQGGLSLQLTQVTLEGRTYPLVSDYWSHQGADKTGNTVGTTVGMGAVGALIGAVAGGGVGAAVGAGIGGIAGLGVSSASRQGEAMIPPEAVLSFRLTQPMELTTVSQAELNRLGAGLPAQGQQPPQMQRRYYPPPPPPPPGYYYPQYR
jgi:BON domain